MQHGKFRLFRRQRGRRLPQGIRFGEDPLPGGELKTRQTGFLRHSRGGRQLPGSLFAAPGPLACGSGAGLNRRNRFAA